MTVARILAEKGRCVVTTKPHKTLQEVASELARHRIGALVVLDGDEEIVGVICERDIVTAIARHGPVALSDLVANHMTMNPRVVAEEDTVDSTMEAMTQERRRHMPVVKGRRLCGLVSIGDVVKYRIQAIEYERMALREYIATA